MFKNRKKILAGLAVSGSFLLGGLFLAPTTFAANSNVNVQVNVNQQSGINWGMGNNAGIVATGFAPKDERGMALSREAAIMAAQRDLVGIVQGVQIDSETTMRDLIIQSDVVNRKITGTLRGYKIIEEGSTDDGGYYVKITIPMYGAGGLADAIVPEIKFDTPQDFETVDTSTMNQNDVQAIQSIKYTGVVILTSGLGLEPTFSPVIYDTNGRAIYGIKNLQPDKVIDKGMVSYSNSVEDNITIDRAGTNPLVINAVEVRGGKNSANKVNAVVSVEDADKILLANENTGMLENCAVVFVK